MNDTANNVDNVEVLPVFKASDVADGLDASKVLNIKVDLDAPRWDIAPDEKTQTAMGITTTPLHLIMAADQVKETESKLSNQQRYLAAHMFNIAAECDDVCEFEAFMLQLKAEAGWNTYPARVRNYKSRIITFFKDEGQPNPGDAVQLPYVNEKGAKDEKTLVTRTFRSMGEYYDHCKESKTAKPAAPATAASPAAASPESVAKIDKLNTEGVEVTADATITTDSEGVETVERDACPFSGMLAELQVLYAQADTNERQRMTKRIKSLAIDIRKDQTTRFAAEDKATA